MAPMHLWAFLDEMVDLRTAAWAEWGGVSKQSLSGELALAIESHYRACREKFGPMPTTKEERRDYIKRMAAILKKEAEESLSKAS